MKSREIFIQLRNIRGEGEGRGGKRGEGKNGIGIRIRIQQRGQKSTR